MAGGRRCPRNLAALHRPRTAIIFYLWRTEVIMSRTFLYPLGILAALWPGVAAAAEPCLEPSPVLGRVLALDPKTGQATEVYKAESQRLTEPAPAPGVLYVGSGYELRAVPLPGAKAKPWSFKADYTVY